MNRIVFNEGEKREVTAVITSRNQKETVIIASANYELKKTTFDGAIIQKGSCEVSGNEATVLLDLAQKGNYELEVFASVGREVIIKKVLVIVE